MKMGSPTVNVVSSTSWVDECKDEQSKLSSQHVCVLTSLLLPEDAI